ncbi:IclR family transcriptional regulator [Streptomyces sp. NPDC005811]|uniref:IclR family transcriptional regulator n=1 Tax=Streptomyces sp. NPDC005811 TaxID=3154565 RepID=UPI0033C67557
MEKQTVAKRRTSFYFEGMLVSPSVISQAATPAGRPSDVSRESPTSSVDKAVSLLIAFSHTSGGATLTELAREAGVSKSTAHRLLGMLRSAGLVDRDEMDWYLRSPVLRLGALALRGEAGILREVALPYMTELYEETHENVHLALLEGDEVVYLEKLYGHRSTPAPSRVGHRVPCHTSGLGKAMLAFSGEPAVRRVVADGLRPASARSVTVPGVFLRQLEAVRTDRVAYDREETWLGLTCVAAPILGPSGRPVAAISVAGCSRTMNLDALAPKVRAAATQIGRKTGPDVDLLAAG